MVGRADGEKTAAILQRATNNNYHKILRTNLFSKPIFMRHVRGLIETWVTARRPKC